jgi:hydroxymethylbilane synthase
MKKIIIGTRGSDLALWQANYTKELLEGKGCNVEIKIIETSGDKSQEWNTSFDKMEGKGFFTKELEDALLKKEIDLAVHSHKDLLTTNPEGLIIAGVSKRANPSELLLIKKTSVDADKQFSLKKGAVVGTSSARRKSQLLAFRPDVELKDLRGNVPTRIKKLKEGELDAILIAAAGPERLELDLSEFHEEILDPKVFVPAPAQGVLAWQIREDDDDLFNTFDDLTDIDVQTQVRIERGVLSLMDGGCQLPLGVYVDTEFDHEDRPVFHTHVSIAKKWDEQPVQLYIATGNSEDLSERIVNHFNGLKPQKVFVSKDFKEKDYLPSALGKLKFEVVGKSLIEFKEIKIRLLPVTEWIFFSSKHAVKYFMGQKPDIGKVKFGCIGSSTSAELRSYGHRAEFIGQGTDTKLIGKQFASKVGSSKVLFPIAKDSMRTVQWQMPKSDNAIDLNVYYTVKHSIELDDSFNILVFTSPSNVEAFFEKNKPKPHQKLIAMGDATELALKKLKMKDITKPASFDDLGLVQAILGRSV